MKSTTEFGGLYYSTKPPVTMNNYSSVSKSMKIDVWDFDPI